MCRRPSIYPPASLWSAEKRGHYFAGQLVGNRRENRSDLRAVRHDEHESIRVDTLNRNDQKMVALAYALPSTDDIHGVQSPAPGAGQQSQRLPKKPESTDFIARVPTLRPNSGSDCKVTNYVALARRKGNTWSPGPWATRELTLVLVFGLRDLRSRNFLVRSQHNRLPARGGAGFIGG